MYTPSVSEAKQLLAAVDLTHPFGVRDYALCQFGLHTALRVGELSALNQIDVAYRGAPRTVLTLPAAITKGHKQRFVPLHSKAQAAIRTLLAFNERRGLRTEPEAPLFQTRYHERLTIRAIQRLIQALREKAGLDVPVTPHSLRHACATQLARVGSIRTVQEMLGHERLTTTQRYDNPTPQEQRTEVERLSFE